MFVIVSRAFPKTVLNTITRSPALSATLESRSVGQVMKCQFIEWLVIVVHARLLKCQPNAAFQTARIQYNIL